ncbi:hypothetical protein JW826_01090 [Candidatus Woesearchaeota archaeon]|nr:hypothetical protein [Candidatus Woesearchaeota archaeon]
MTATSEWPLGMEPGAISDPGPDIILPGSMFAKPSIDYLLRGLPAGFISLTDNQMWYACYDGSFVDEDGKGTKVPFALARDPGFAYNLTARFSRANRLEEAGRIEELSITLLQDLKDDLLEGKEPVYLVRGLCADKRLFEGQAWHACYSGAHILDDAVPKAPYVIVKSYKLARELTASDRDLCSFETVLLVGAPNMTCF